jgi:exopolysaccharide biosynthesis polyprenyl glycosylphosphotransferase
MADVRHNRSWFGSIRLILFDLTALFFCGVISSELRGNLVPFVNFTVSDGVLVLATCLTGLAVVGGYETRRDMCTLRYASEHILAMGAILLGAFIVTYTFTTYNNSIKPGRSVLFVGLLLFAPLSLTYRRLLSAKRSREAAARFIYVIGTQKLVSDLEMICRQAHFRHPLRFIDLESENGAYQGIREILSKELDQCEGVVIDLSKGKLDPDLQEILLQINLHLVPVYPVEAFIETYFYKVDLSHVTLSWALDGTFKADHHSVYGKLKTLIDVVFGAFLFLLTLPLMLAAAVMIKLGDFGPILFTQLRVGRFERPFLLYKFRTMTVGTGDNESLYTLKNDRRITRVGRFLRLTRIDELPQLWNVVKGDMSIIGPRAEWDKLVEIYKKEIPFYHLRYMVKPGITGWAQVNYGYGADIRDTFEKLQYDLYYIKHYSPHMDASIILKTLFTILSASGR